MIVKFIVIVALAIALASCAHYGGYYSDYGRYGCGQYGWQQGCGGCGYYGH